VWVIIPGGHSFLDRFLIFLSISALETKYIKQIQHFNVLDRFLIFNLGIILNIVTFVSVTGARNAAQGAAVLKKVMESGLIKFADKDHPRVGYHPWWA